jgi:hypothetical protein
MDPHGAGVNVTPVRGILAENPLKHKIQGNWVVGQFPITASSSTGRRNTIQCIDSAMLSRENRSVWLYSVKT